MIPRSGTMCTEHCTGDNCALSVSIIWEYNNYFLLVNALEVCSGDYSVNSPVKLHLHYHLLC